MRIIDIDLELECNTFRLHLTEHIFIFLHESYDLSLPFDIHVSFFNSISNLSAPTDYTSAEQILEEQKLSVLYKYKDLLYTLNPLHTPQKYTHKLQGVLEPI